MIRSIVKALIFIFIVHDVTAYGADLFLAVGYGGRRMISSDGLAWEITAEWAQPGGDDGNNLMSAVYAQGKFVVVGGGGGGNSGDGHILLSADGRTWREVHTAKNRINPIVYGRGRFVVGAPGRRLLWSENGESWQEGAQLEDKLCTHFRGGAFGNDRFVFVGNHGGGGGPHWSAVSPDGESISGIRTDLPGHGTIVFGGGRFLMLTSHSDADLLASTDGLKWKQVVVADEAKWNWLVWTGKSFLIGGKKSIFESPDGAVWTQTDLAPARGAVRWSDGKRFIASSWPGRMYFSGDGKSWQDAAPLSANGINRVVRGEKSP